MRMFALHKQTRIVLRFIIEYHKENDCTSTIREIHQATNIGNNQVCTILSILEARNDIACVPRDSLTRQRYRLSEDLKNGKLHP